jgi:hypothetical protein
MTVATIGPLIAAAFFPTYASTWRTKRTSVEGARHRWKASRTGYGASSSGCATVDMYWDIADTNPRFQLSDAFLYSLYVKSAVEGVTTKINGAIDKSNFDPIVINACLVASPSLSPRQA